MSNLHRQLIRTAVSPTTLDIQEFLGEPVQVFSYVDMGIDEARSLRELLSLRTRAQSAGLVIAVDTMTDEAQQALLKVFEESGERLVFVVAEGVRLLPTVISRFTETDWPGGIDAHDDVAIQKWLAGEIRDRIGWIEKEKKKLTLARVRAFVTGIARNATNSKEAKAACLLAQQYLQSGSVPPTMIIEYLAIAMPQV